MKLEVLAIMKQDVFGDTHIFHKFAQRAVVWLDMRQDIGTLQPLPNVCPPSFLLAMHALRLRPDEAIHL